jgi:hypothetical protein
VYTKNPTVGALPESFVEIDGVQVDRRIFTTPFICDVVIQQCRSACCHRGCVVTGGDVERLTPHMDGIVRYLPEAKREFLRREGGNFVGDPDRQGTDMLPQETMAMIRFFKSAEEMRCTWVVDDECVFLYPSTQPAPDNGHSVAVNHCAVHSYALERGMDWPSFKPADCVQFPLCFYQKDGRTVLALQEEPGQAIVPCLNNPIGPPMYRSLEGTIIYLLGERFNEKVQAYGREHFPE